MTRRTLCPLVFLPLLLAACASPAPPVAEKAPGARLFLDRVEAAGPERVSLYFTLEVENPRNRPVALELRNWRLYLNEIEGPAGALLSMEGGPPRIAAAASTAFPLRLDLEPDREAGLSAGEDSPGGDYRAKLNLELAYTGEDGGTLTGEASAEAVFPRVREPVFTITAITIRKAELINTRFQVNLRIDNPNVFPLDLSALNYELYGAGRFWADGTETETLHIPGQAFAEARLFLVMNFINMKRELLDQVLVQRQVPYRFTGSAEIETGLDHLPRFRMDFDQSGFSEVAE
jgi:LEA14-like dessication related protein